MRVSGDCRFCGERLLHGAQEEKKSRKGGGGVLGALEYTHVCVELKSLESRRITLLVLPLCVCCQAIDAMLVFFTIPSDQDYMHTDSFLLITCLLENNGTDSGFVIVQGCSCFFISKTGLVWPFLTMCANTNTCIELGHLDLWAV